MGLKDGNMSIPEGESNTNGMGANSDSGASSSSSNDSSDKGNSGKLDENQGTKKPNKDGKNNDKSNNKNNDKSNDKNKNNDDKNNNKDKPNSDGQNKANDNSFAGDDKSKGLGNNKQADPASVAKKGMKHQAMKTGAQAGGNVGLGAAIMSKIMAFLKMMQSMVASAMNAVTGLIAQILGAIMNVVNTVVSFFSGLFGISSTVVQVGLIVAFGGLLFGSVSVGAVILSNDGYKDGIVESCTIEAEKQLKEADDAEFNDGANNMIENAQKIYSVFKEKGLGDMQIAGILANYETESSIDPTTVEGAYGDAEKYKVTGPKTAGALKDLNKYTLEVVFPLYDNNKPKPIGINKAAYKASNGKYYPGIGIVQWTGGGAKNLMEGADAAGIPWYTMDYQMAYMIQKGAPTGFADFWNKYKNEKFANAGDAALYFAKNYEGHVVDNEPRAKAAEKWVKSIKSYQVDKAYANNILSLANDTSAQATEDVKNEIISDCIQAAQEDDNYAHTEVGKIDVKSKYYMSESPHTQGGYWGQCTWFVWGRIYEKLNIKTHPSLGNGAEWYATASAMSPAEQAKWGIKGTGKDPKPNSAVSMVNTFGPWGHVAFIEKIDKGKDKVWISEGNINGLGSWITREYPLSKLKKENTIGGGQGQIQGYIYYQ